MGLTTEAQDLQGRASMNSHSRPGCHAGNLLNVAAEKGISRARVRGETYAPFWQRLAVEKAKVSVENPVVLGHECLVLAFEDVEETLQVDGSRCGG